MQKQNYTLEKFEQFIKDTEAECGTKYTSQLRAEWKRLGDWDDCQPSRMLRVIKEADPEYKAHVAGLLAGRKKRLGVVGCAA